MAEQIGKYIIQRQLGSGTFGNVYQALDPDLQKIVAIKKLKMLVGSEPDFSAGDNRLVFTREAQETGKLAHSNIVTLHGIAVDEKDNVPFLVMEFVEGETLESFIARNTRCPLIEKMELMQQVAEGLQYAHTRGVRHRDIKPANIMILRDGTAKILDFGVAPEGKMIGTPAYMAPEQYSGQDSDVMTDVFSFGAVYYELLTGQRAYDPQSEAKHQTSSYEPPSAGKLVPECPPWLEELISRLMAKRRQDRVESLEEMLLYTRPTLQDLKRKRADEMATNIQPLIKAGKREEAESLIDRVLRLNPLNRQALDARGRSLTVQRDQQRARAGELARKGQKCFDAGEFEEAEKAFSEAFYLDAGASGVERLRDRSREKAEDRRAANRLVDEVVDDIISCGRQGMAPFQLENAVLKLTRATHLDPRCRDAVELRAEMQPFYEDVCIRQMCGSVTRASPTATTELYERRLREALIARKKGRSQENYDFAESILRNLLHLAPDDRAMRELAAVVSDREALKIMNEKLRMARDYGSRGDLEAAKCLLDDFAVQYPRHAKGVQVDRQNLEGEIERLAGSNRGGNIH